jgi:hypothetical protein
LTRGQPEARPVTERAEVPGTMIEVVLAAWREVLGDPTLGPDADFFVNGGHSLLAVQLVSRVASATGFEVPLPYLFLHPTPEEFTQAMTALVSEDESGARDAPGGPSGRSHD